MAEILVLVPEPELADSIAAGVRAAGLAASVQTEAGEVTARLAARPPALIVLDLAMDLGQGVALCHLIREAPGGDLVPILLLGTGQEGVSSFGDALAEGADYYFQKPVDLELLISKIQTYVVSGASSPPPGGQDTAGPAAPGAGLPPEPTGAELADRVERMMDLGSSFMGGLLAPPGGPDSQPPPVEAPPAPAAPEGAGRSLADELFSDVTAEVEQPAEAGGLLPPRSDGEVAEPAPRTVAQPRSSAPREGEFRLEPIAAEDGARPDGQDLRSFEEGLMDAAALPPPTPAPTQAEVLRRADDELARLEREARALKQAEAEAEMLRKAEEAAAAREAARAARARHLEELEEKRAAQEAERAAAAREEARAARARHLEELEEKRAAQEAERAAAAREEARAARARHVEELVAKRAAEEEQRRRKEEEARKLKTEIEKKRRELEEKKRREAEEKRRRDEEEKARKEAEEKKRRDDEEKARKEAEEKRRRDDEEKARKQAEEKKRRDDEEKARKQAEEKKRRDDEEKARKQAEEKKRRDDEEKARKEAEEKKRRDDEEKARKEAEEKKRRDDEEKARKEAEEKKRRDDEEKARKEAEEKKRRDDEEKARKEAEEKKRRDDEEKARKEAEEKTRREAEEKRRRQAEEQKQRAEAESRRKEAEEEEALRLFEEKEKQRLAALREQERAEQERTAAAPAEAAEPPPPDDLWAEALGVEMEVEETETDHDPEVSTDEAEEMARLASSWMEEKLTVERTASGRILRPPSGELGRPPEGATPAEAEGADAEEEPAGRTMHAGENLIRLLEREAALARERAAECADEPAADLEITSPVLPARPGEAPVAAASSVRAQAGLQTEPAPVATVAEVPPITERTRVPLPSEPEPARTVTAVAADAERTRVPAPSEAEPDRPAVRARPRPGRQPLPRAPTAEPAPAEAPDLFAPAPPAELKAPDPDQADLSKERVPALLWRLHLQQVTGAVRLASGGDSKEIFLERGVPVAVRSSQTADRFEELLYREGLIDREAYAEARVKGLSQPRPLAAHLVERGFLRPEELFPLVRRHLEECLIGLFEWTAGEARYLEQQARDADKVRLSRPVAGLIMEGIRRKYLLLRMAHELGGPSSLLAPVPAGDRSPLAPDAAALGLSGMEREVLQLVDGLRPIEEIVFLSGRDEATVYRVLLAAVVTGVLAVAVQGLPGTGPGPEAAVLRDVEVRRRRLQAKFEQLNHGSYFDILGLAEDATPYEIQAAFERLRREFHAVHYAHPALRELAPKLDVLRRTLDEAEDVLSDELLREGYRQSLKNR